MKTINEILDHWEEWETFIEDRFGKRLCAFLTVEQAEKIGWKFNEGHVHTPKEWSKENILEQLRQDVGFGWEKACDERGISASLMFDVVLKWCRVLEDGLENWNENHYGPYGKPLFQAVAKKYGWELDEEY